MTKTILFLASNPINTDRLQLDKEVSAIEEALSRAKHRENFVLKQKWAVSPEDLRRAMLELGPEIVHFSGHGAENDGIVLEDSVRNPTLVTTEALEGFFALFPHVECVLLNACYSEDQAKGIARNVKYVIGMRQQIGDEAARNFSISFYDALGAGKSVEFAYKLACNALQMFSIPEHLAPVLTIGNANSIAHLLPSEKSSAFDSKPIHENPWSQLAKFLTVVNAKLLRVRILIATTLVGVAIAVGIFSSYSLTPKPAWEYVSGRGMVLSSLKIHNGDLYIGVARDDPRNHGLYRIDIHRCDMGLSMTPLIKQSPIYDISFWNNQGLAGTDSGVMYYSHDNGYTWQVISTTVIGPRIYSITNIGGSNYAGTEGFYVYASQKNPSSPWTPLTEGPTDINKLKDYADTLWIGTYGQGIWKLGLNEQRFSNQSEGLSGSALIVWDIIFSRLNTIYIATSNGIYEGNGLSSWHSIGLQGETVLSMELTDENLYAGTKGRGIFRMSLSNPEHWVNLSLKSLEGEQSGDYTVLNFPPFSGGRVKPLA